MFFTCNFNTAIWSFIHVSPTILLFLISTTENPADISRLLFTTTTHQRKTVFELCVRKWYAYAAAAKESPQQERKNEKIHSVFLIGHSSCSFLVPPTTKMTLCLKLQFMVNFFLGLLQRCCLRQSQKNDLFLNLLMISYWPYRILHCWKKLPSDSWCLMNETYFCSSVPLLSKNQTSKTSKTATKQLLLV